MFFCLFNLVAEVKTDLPRRLTQSRAGDIEIWQVILTFASVFLAGMQTEQAKRSADEAKRSADEAKRSADQEFKASAEGKSKQRLQRP